jgi:hypothetical protein
MASDLPDTGHASSEAMARTLVQYMACPERVRDAIKLEFDRPPTTGTIRRLRAEYLASLEKPPEAPWKPHEGHRPAEAADKASEATRRFLEALRRERERSFLRKQAALKSPFLTRQDLVDHRFDSEVEQAFRDNQELAA